MKHIRIAIAGIGNCASALVQGIAFYGDNSPKRTVGLIHETIGPWACSDIEIVAAFDIDRRKVGRPIEEAIFAKPNCTKEFVKRLPPSDVRVQMGPILDGVAPHMIDAKDEDTFQPAEGAPVDVCAVLQEARAEILVCYLPVGSEQAVLHYAQACLDASVAMVNCVPVFLASNPSWAEKFRDAGIPLIGDDIKSQLGATILHRTLASLFAARGVSVDRTYQLNTGGNTDFRNMLASDRLSSKKHSKTESVQSQLPQRLSTTDIHVGPSDYIRWLSDGKICFMRLEGRGFGDLPVEIELRLSVEDSPNSAGVVIDAIRCAKLAVDRGLSGPIEAVSAWYMKSPPRQISDSLAHDLCEAFIRGDGKGGNASVVDT